MVSRFLVLIAVVSLLSCSNNSQELRLYGRAQGTTYSITYITESGVDYHSSIDSILIAVDKSMSTWLKSSIISRLNRGEDSVDLDHLFLDVINRSLEISEITNGSFDVTVAPLVNAYGFGPTEQAQVDSTLIDSLMALVGYNKLEVVGNRLKKDSLQQIDFNAIAQGYAVDVIAEFMNSKKINNYLVEVGGELITKGTNFDGNKWRIGIDKPQEEIDTENRFQIILKLSGSALATSGNYRKFNVDEKSGVKYVHTIDPKTGYPVKSRLLSASIISNSCMDADAFATSCMVKGIKASQKLIEDLDGVEGYLIFSDKKGNLQEWKSPGFHKYTQD